MGGGNGTFVWFVPESGLGVSAVGLFFLIPVVALCVVFSLLDGSFEISHTILDKKQYMRERSCL